MSKIRIVGKKPVPQADHSTREAINQEEYLMQCVSEFNLEKYFNIFTNHGAINFNKNIFALYTNINGVLPNVKIIENIVFSDIVCSSYWTEDDSDETRFCFDGFEPDYRIVESVEGDQIIRFTAFESEEKDENGNNYLSWIGDYFINNNTFIGCDLTHTEFYRNIIPRIIQTLIDRKYLKPINNKKEEKDTKKITVLLGADPEFECLNNENKVVSAGALNNPKIKGTNSTDKVGRDGAGSQLEIRPDPADSPMIVTKNIKDIFEYISELNLSARGDYYPLGGHIHIGVGFRYDPTPEFLKLLDFFIGRPTMRLNGKARKESGYGRESQRETKPYGFEYRTPPAAIFSSPEITRITFKIAKNISEHYLNEGVFEFENGMDQDPTKEEYKKYAKLTDLEYDKFNNFLQNFFNVHLYTNNLVENWIKSNVKLSRPHFKINLIFEHIWNPELKEMITKFVSKIGTYNRDIKIVLYGLKEERDISVVGFECPNMKTITHARKKAPDSDLQYGLPFNYRKLEMDSDQHSVVTDHLLRKIYQESLRF